MARVRSDPDLRALSDGVHFLTMQLVEGQPLDKLIPESGLPLDRILEIATGDRRGAPGFVLKVNFPGHWFSYAAISRSGGSPRMGST